MKYLLNENRKLRFSVINLFILAVFFNHLDIISKTINPKSEAKRNGTENRSKCSRPREYSKCKSV